MSKNSVLILGGASDIGMATAHRFAESGHPIQLAARNVSRLEAAKTDLSVRHNVAVELLELDVLDDAQCDGFVASLETLPETVVCVIGFMGDQSESETNAPAARTVMRSNYEGPACLMAHFANAFVARGNGSLVGVSSVAGERGRASNYVYGSAKAGFTAFLSGLRNRVTKQNVHVVTVLPGFVNTRMTEGMDLPAKLLAQPSDVGNAIFNAVEKQKNVVYTLPIWRLVMFVITHIPEFIFKKTSL